MPAMPAPRRALAIWGIVLGVWLGMLPAAHAAAVWQTRSVPHFYFVYQLRDAALIETLAAESDAIYQQITADVGYAPARKITVYFCPTADEFRQKQPAGVTLPDWAVGVAYPALHRIVMRSAVTSPARERLVPRDVFQHEFAHIVLEQALASSGGAPRWLSEGFAMYHAKEWRLTGQQTLAEVALRDAFLPLAVLTTSFPADETAARLAYAQSFSLVAFFLHDFGRPTFHRFLNYLQSGLDTNTALRAATGLDLKHFEIKWQRALRKRTSWLTYLSERGLFYFLLSLVVLLAYVVKQWKAKRLQQRWEDEEAQAERASEFSKLKNPGA